MSSVQDVVLNTTIKIMFDERIYRSGHAMSEREKKRCHHEQHTIQEVYVCSGQQRNNDLQ